jgi:hypothetical protein
VDGGEAVASGLVVASGDGAEALEVVEEDLDEVSAAIELSVESSAPSLSRGVAADDDLHAASANLASEVVGVVASVADEGAPVGVREQLVGDGHFVALALGQRDVERAAFRVDERVDLGGEATSRTTQSVSLDPPFPPEASWCARMTEPSTMQPVLSTRICSALNTLAQMPRRAQLEKRL